MNILMMTNTYAPIVGGLERSIENFTENLRKRGHKVLIITPEYKGSPREEHHVIRIPAIEKIAGTAFSLNVPVPGFATQAVEAFNPDVIHAHHPFFVGDMALRMCGQHNIPLVFTYHTNFEDYTHMLPIDNESIKQFLIELSSGYANLADNVIVPSASIGRLLKRRNVHKPIHIVPTGVDIEKYSKGTGSKLRKKFNIGTRDFVLGHLGRLSAEKNLPFLMEALSLFLQKQGKTHVLIVGNGPDRKLMQDHFKRAGVNERVHFAGVLNGKDLVEAYRAMNAFAYASKSETQGMVITEAMAAGLPVVALDAPGVREVVKDQVNGRLLKKENVLEFSNALEEIFAKNKEEFAALSRSAIQTAEKFSQERCTQKLLRVYTRAINQGTALENNALEELVGRLQTEWGMFKNFGHAFVSGMKEFFE